MVRLLLPALLGIAIANRNLIELEDSKFLSPTMNTTLPTAELKDLVSDKAKKNVVTAAGTFPHPMFLETSTISKMTRQQALEYFDTHKMDIHQRHREVGQALLIHSARLHVQSEEYQSSVPTMEELLAFEISSLQGTAEFDGCVNIFGDVSADV